MVKMGSFVVSYFSEVAEDDTHRELVTVQVGDQIVQVCLHPDRHLSVVTDGLD